MNLSFLFESNWSCESGVVEDDVGGCRDEELMEIGSFGRGNGGRSG